jgi:tRNA G37 N-methylase Trm5
MNVEIREGDCTFRFDYSKVYWNSRLQTEHKRLVDMFNPGDVVCDVMAGVGPFAVPAGKKGVFVWANDLNPNSYAALKEAVVRNKVSLLSFSFRLFCSSSLSESLFLSHDDSHHDGQHNHKLVYLDENASDKAL